MGQLTDDQLAFVRRRLGNFSASVDDAELQLYSDDAHSINADTYVYGTVAFAYEALVTGAVTFTDVKQGETTENQAVIFARLNGLLSQWNAKAGYTGLPVVRVKAVRQHYVDLPCDPTGWEDD